MTLDHFGISKFERYRIVEMTVADDEDFLAKLAEIRDAYCRDSLPQQVRDLQSDLAAVLEAWEEHGADTSLDPLHTSAHKLAGSAGTFGLQTVSRLAAEIAEITDPREKSTPRPTKETLARLEDLTAKTVASAVTLLESAAEN